MLQHCGTAKVPFQVPGKAVTEEKREDAGEDASEIGSSLAQPVAKSRQISRPSQAQRHLHVVAAVLLVFADDAQVLLEVVCG